MHRNARPRLFKQAYQLRREQTIAEKRLWQELRSKKLNGYKFRRQHPVARFIIDFYCHKANLIIEVDGSIHDEKVVTEYDNWREAELIAMGFRMIRIRNQEVMDNIQLVKQRIMEALEEDR